MKDFSSWIIDHVDAPARWCSQTLAELRKDFEPCLHQFVKQRPYGFCFTFHRTSPGTGMRRCRTLRLRYRLAVLAHALDMKTDRLSDLASGIFDIVPTAAGREVEGDVQPVGRAD